MKTVSVSTASVGHNAGEVYLKLGEYVVILPPQVAKQLSVDLRALIDQVAGSERTPKSLRKQEPISKQVLKALFKGRKVSKSLLSINTGRRKKLPDS